MNILDTILANKAREVLALHRQGLYEVYQKLSRTRPANTLSMSHSLLDTPGGIIAEFKRRSPSRGEIFPQAGVEKVVPVYTAGGAAACSVLTDTRFFGGSLDDLRVARQCTTLPLLRKDFIIDPVQIYQAHVSGASAVLLIAAALDEFVMKDLADTAHACGLEVLVEIHNADEARKIPATADMVGINNRDLTTFHTDLEASMRLLDLLPDTAVKVAESGINSPRDITRLRQAGFQAFLIGQALMESTDPILTLKNFING